MAPAIEILARGVLVHRGYILLATPAEAPYFYLPGGHIEFGEAARWALRRELAEELGVEVTVGPFLGAVEHAFTTDDGRPHAEINLVFSFSCAALHSDRPAPSREADVAFHWQPLERLNRLRLLPAVLQQCLPRWLAEGHAAGWASTWEL